MCVLQFPNIQVATTRTEDGHKQNTKTSVTTEHYFTHRSTDTHS
jgi:hypothetical protein